MRVHGTGDCYLCEQSQNGSSGDKSNFARYHFWVPRESVAFEMEITKILLCTRQSPLTLNCSVALTDCLNVATPPARLSRMACIAALQNENASNVSRRVTITIAKGHSCPSTSAPHAVPNIRTVRRRPANVPFARRSANTCRHADKPGPRLRPCRKTT